MDQSTAEEWVEIGRQTAANQPRVADSVLSMLRSLAAVTDGFATDQLTHCLQTATLAEKAGADTEVIVGDSMGEMLVSSVLINYNAPAKSSTTKIKCISPILFHIHYIALRVRPVKTDELN